MTYHAWRTIVATMILGACGAGNETATDTTWRERALMDLDFIYAQLGEHHPGPVDTLNPWFRDWYERGYEAARGRAESITDYAGYYFAIQYYMMGFQDGHLGALGDYRIEADLDRRWSGFLVEYDRGAFFVIGNDSGDAELPPTGARLLSCDGASASALADSKLETYIGLWSANELFFHQSAGPPIQRTLASNPVGGRVFFLTDAWCASACLGFADLVLAIDGVTHIGAETSADAIYIDNRSVALPSEQGRFGFSMKVYRGRVRGHNVSYVPDLFWDGSMADDEGLERWVLELAKPLSN